MAFTRITVIVSLLITGLGSSLGLAPERLLAATEDSGKASQASTDRVTKQEELILQILGDRRSGLALAIPSLESSEKFSMIGGKVTTIDEQEFSFTNQAGSMLRITNVVTGAKFGVIVSIKPDLAPASTTESKLEATQSNFSTLEGQFVVQDFRILNSKDGEGLVEVNLVGNDIGDSYQNENYRLSVERLFYLFTKGEASSSRPGVCCISCGFYQICGNTLVSSCESCSGGGSGSR